MGPRLKLYLVLEDDKVTLQPSESELFSAFTDVFKEVMYVCVPSSMGVFKTDEFRESWVHKFYLPLFHINSLGLLIRFCSVQKTYLRLLTIGLALARASAQLQDSNIPPTGRVAGGDTLSPSLL